MKTFKNKFRRRTRSVDTPQSTELAEEQQPTTQSKTDAAPVPVTETVSEETPQMEAPLAEQSTPAESQKVCKIFVVFYSIYGHVYKMAQAIKAGIDSVEGCEAELYQVAETLSEEVLGKMHAPPKPEIPVIDPSTLTEADGLMFGFPTRFGMMCAQMKAMFDATGSLWMKGALAGKPAGLFIATGTQNGGQETSCMTAVTQLAHHGMIFIPPGYTLGSPLFDVDSARGGSPWGAGTLAGSTGKREPSETELAFAEHQGKYFAEKTKLLC